ncbi:hypothetical protein SBY92_001960 [Candida maltosa Xu316]
MLLDTILETSMSRPVSDYDKEYLLDYCLKTSVSLSIDVFFKIISSIGVSITTTHANERHVKKPPTTIQLSVLAWVIESYDYFKDSILASGTLSITLLVKTLEYEFSRGPISQLIILILSHDMENIITFYNREMYHRIRLLKPAHIQSVVNLYSKFPLDIYLKELLAFFRIVIPDLDYISYSPDNFPILNNLASNLKRIYSWEFPDLVLEPRNKKQKTTVTEDDVEVYGIQVFYQANKINPYKLFRRALSDEKDAQVLVLLLQTSDELFISKINQYIDANFKTFIQNDYDLHSFLEKIVHVYNIGDGTVKLSSVEDNIVNTPIKSKNFFQEMDLRSQIIRFLVSVDVEQLAGMISRDTSSLHNLFISDTPISFESCVSYVDSILHLLQIWVSRDEIDTGFRINIIVPELFKFSQYCRANQDWLTVKIVSFIDTLDNDLFKRLSDKAILPPRTLVYSCLLSCDPFVMSAICEHISKCKDHHYQDPKWRNIQNTFIMDTVNILWKGRFLKQDSSASSSSKGFFLHPDMMDKLSFLHVFDGTLSRHSIGELFYNPALSYIVTKMIWEIEDKDDRITTRHEGPVTRDSIDRLGKSVEKTWLNVTYDDLKLQLLQALDSKKMTGIGDLLFGSLKSLSDKRKSQ